MHLLYALCNTTQYKKTDPGSEKTCTAHACFPPLHPSHPDNTISAHAKQPIPAYQMNLHLIPNLLASNSRPRQVKRYEPLCGSCTPKGCYLLTCRGHPPLRGAFPLDPFPASRAYGRRPLETVSGAMLSEAVSSLISPYLKQQISTPDTTIFPSGNNIFPACPNSDFPPRNRPIIGHEKG